MAKRLKTSSIPTHVAMIMDGNRRWARQHGLEVIQGHTYAVEKVIEPLVTEAAEQGVKFVTMWLFSTENWNRERSEVDGLMNLFRDALDKEAAKLHEQGVRILTIGEMSKFAPDIQQKAADWVAKTAANDRITLTFALNYGGRDEIVRAVQLLDKAGQAVTADSLSSKLDTGRQGIPDPDLIIRPGGEQRLSGYLLWQSEYAELYFTDKMTPEFTREELRIALAEYADRQRRFGK